MSDAVLAALPDAAPIVRTREAVLKGAPGVQQLHVLAWRRQNSGNRGT